MCFTLALDCLCWGKGRERGRVCGARKGPCVGVCGLYNYLLGLCVQGQAGLGLGVGVPEPKVCLKGS